MPRTRLLGYWIVSHDQASALEAVRMAGLPLLLMGFNLLVLALLTLSASPSLAAFALGMLGTALACIILAFRLRGGHAGWVPIVALLFVTYLAASLALTIFVTRASAIPNMSGTMIVTQWVIPIICLILISAGIRGWLWLRANGVKASF